MAVQRSIWAVLSAVAILAALLSSASSSSASAVVDGQSYIVVLQPGADDVAAVANEMARAQGGRVGFVYEHALKGFSIIMSPRAAAALARNPRVAYVEADQEVTLAAQDMPTGIDRIFASTNTALDIDGLDDYRVDVDVAVIDTGVDFDHPDLNVVGGVNCASGSPFNKTCKSGGDDDHYHGTHVAGTIAALDNGIGVVGVAPGARIHAVKVLKSNGSGYTSWIVAGIDWVTAQGTIEVANMSLGGSGFSQAEYDAIQGAVESGVAFAVAAGNSNADANNYSPAAFDNALTVSALADFDGIPGGLGSSTCRTDQDDTLADFSNWGDAVQIAAPGVCILSTYPIEKGSYGTISGTSMASPHAAGALALLASNSPASNALEVQGLYDAVIAAGNFGWTDDSGDGIWEPLLDVSGFSANLTAGGGGGGTTTTTTTTTTAATTTTTTTAATTTTTTAPPNSDLVASSVNNGKTWTAILTSTSDVSGTWTVIGGTSAVNSCTASSGSCSVSLSGIPKKVGSVTFTVDGSGETVRVFKP